MYLLILALFAVGIGALGSSLFMIMVQKEKKKAIPIGVIGLVLIIVTMASNHLRPSSEEVTSILVEQAVVTNDKNKDGLYECKIIDVYLTYEYANESFVKAENFCAQFKPGEKYDIKYRFKSGSFLILEVQ